MAAATGRVASDINKYTDTHVYRDLAAGTYTMYVGCMVCVNSAGYGVKASDTAGLQFDGIMADSADIGVTAADAAGDKRVCVERPFRFRMKIAAAVIADIGKPVYALFDNEVAYGGTSNSIMVGWVDEVLSATLISIRPAYAGIRGDASFDAATLTYTGGNAANSIAIPDNLADALSIKQGSNSFLTVTTTDGGEKIALIGPAATTATAAGGAVQLTGGIGGATSGLGGAITGTAGAGTAGNSAGGAVLLTGGAGQGSAAGGAAGLVGGVGGATGAGGAVALTGGAGGATSGTGGAATITAGAGAAGNSAGGVAGLTGGAGQGSAAGGVGKVVGGVGGATGAGGAAQVTGGAGGATSGTGGAVAIAGGAGTAGNASGGAVTINGGALNGSGANGSVTIQSAYAPVAGGGTSAAILCTSTALLGLYFGTGAPTFSAAKGSLYCKTDAATSATRLYIASDAVGTWTAFTSAA